MTFLLGQFFEDGYISFLKLTIRIFYFIISLKVYLTSFSPSACLRKHHIFIYSNNIVVGVEVITVVSFIKARPYQKGEKSE